jgi:hypothetical protein
MLGVIADGVWIGDRIQRTLNTHSLLHFTDNCLTLTTVHCVAWERFPTVDDPVFASSRLCRLAAISHQSPALLTTD